jgi:hypothetical protein
VIADLDTLLTALYVELTDRIIALPGLARSGPGGLRLLPQSFRWYWGAKLLLIWTCDGTITGFGLANPTLFGEREHARQMLKDHPANRPGAQHRHRHRQGPVRRGHRGLLRQPGPGPDPDPPSPQGREGPLGTSRTGCGNG